MHDGPAQSIANIALQARSSSGCMQRDPAAAEARAGRAARDGPARARCDEDLHLRRPPDGPRRPGPGGHAAAACLEKARRSGVQVRFESAGQDRRLGGSSRAGCSASSRMPSRPSWPAAGGGDDAPRLDGRRDARRSSAAHAEPRQQTQPVGAAVAGRDGDATGLADVMRDRQDYEATKAAERVRATALPDGVWAEISAGRRRMGIEVRSATSGHLPGGESERPVCHVLSRDRFLIYLLTVRA
jgi:hypothetical protein